MWGLVWGLAACQRGGHLRCWLSAAARPLALPPPLAKLHTWAVCPPVQARPPPSASASSAHFAAPALLHRAVAPPAERFLKYHEEWLKRCLLRIFSAPPRSGARPAPAAPAAAVCGRNSGRGARVLLCCRARSALACRRRLPRCDGAPINAPAHPARPAPPTCLPAVERQHFRLAALRECHSCMWRAGCSALPFEAAVWLLEEEEELKGGHVPVGGQVRLGWVPTGRAFERAGVLACGWWGPAGVSRR